MKTAKEKKLLKQKELRAYQMKVRSKYEDLLLKGYGKVDAKNLCADHFNLSFATVNNYIRLTQKSEEV